MVDIILHLWRSSWIFGINNAYHLMDQSRTVQLESQMFAPHDGTMERFQMRIHRNDSTSLVKITFFVNGVPKSDIEIDSVGQVGDFLPDLKLPIPFIKNDIIVFQITGIATSSIDAEFDCDLKFTL